MRVFEVAKDLSVPAEGLVQLLREMDIPVRSHMSDISDEHVARVRTLLPPHSHCPVAAEHNLLLTHPEVVAHLNGRMEAWIAKREKETGLPNPIYHQGDWHGHAGVGPFETSQQAYDTLHIGDPKQAARLQSEERK